MHTFQHALTHAHARTHTYTHRLTVDSGDDNGPHEQGLPGVGALSVQGDDTRAYPPRAAVDGVVRVGVHAVHHRPVVPVIWVHRQHLAKEQLENPCFRSQYIIECNRA